MGLETSLYRYQNVSHHPTIRTPKLTLMTTQRSVNRMVQMEMDPKHLIDPRLTRFIQAGSSDKSYYVNLTTFDIQLHPGRYDLPRGGIL